MRASDGDGARDGAREDDDASSSEDSLADALEAELFASERDDAETDDARRATVGSARAREGREDDAPRVVRRKTNALGAIKGASAGEACAHPAFMFDICVVCGERRATEDARGGAARGRDEGDGRGLRGHFTTSMKYIHEGLTLSNEELEKAKREEKARVLQNGKLTLILDLDHTLLNSTQFKELTQEQHDLLHECIAREAEGLKEGQRPMLYCLRHMGFFTKLRPHVFEFLESVSKICQPYVYTMGDKPYAREMVKLIDPEGTIFHGRVISNNDSTSSHVKDLDIVLGGEASAIIVDDTERVWPQNQGNLIRLDRYHFFPGSASSFQQKGQSVMESSMVDEGELGSVGSRAVLLDVLAVIESVHRSFFKNTDDGEEPDVRKLLIHPDRADLPLSGVKFMMSGVTTLGDRRPERHPLRLLASTLGAEFASSIERDGNTVTHVIARSSGTDKVKWARKTSGRVFVVEPGWLVACARANTRVSESLYELQ
jgi:RNA polymerase II C-terminal domain phosphatase-like 3/4